MEQMDMDLAWNELQARQRAVVDAARSLVGFDETMNESVTPTRLTAFFDVLVSDMGHAVRQYAAVSEAYHQITTG